MDNSEMVPEVKPDEQVPRERMLLKPCDTISKPSAGETMFIKPCDTISKRPIGSIRPCHSISQSLPKKRHVDVDKMDLDEGRLVDLPPIQIEEGRPLDVIALLSTNDRDYLVSPRDDARFPISSLHGKYVLVCGFSVPVLRRSEVASDFQAIQALYADLSLRGIADDVIVVIVAKLSPGFTELDLRSFFSMVPVNCLVVPPSDSQSHHYLCDSLCYHPNLPTVTLLPHLVVNPSGIVLKHSADFLRKYGPISFPFTEEHFKILGLEDSILEHQLYFSYDPMTVKQLLRCSNLTEIGNEMNFKSADKLDNAVVGLYLYFDGEFMDKLQDIHKKCVEKGLKFEIILVPLAFHCESDPASFYKLMKEHALKYSTSLSWLSFPFNDKICRTLWRLFSCREKDQLIILQHDKFPGELFGARVASRYGIEAYPFTRAVVVDRKISELRSFTSDELFEEFDVEFIYSRSALLHIDYLKDGRPPWLEKSFEIRAKYPDIAEIFIPVTTDKTSGLCVSAVEVGNYVNKLIFMKGTYVEEPVRDLVVVFGKDGKIVSRHENGVLPSWTTPANIFDDTLRSDYLYELRFELEYECELVR